MMPQDFFALDKVLFVRSVVVAMPGFQPSDEGVDIQPVNDISVLPDEQRPGTFFASMKTVINENKADSFPYHIEMECVCGLHQIDQSLSPQDALRGATITAHSVLYGAIRESIAWITGRQPWGAINLGLSTLNIRRADPASTAPAKAKSGKPVDSKQPDGEPIGPKPE